MKKIWYLSMVIGLCLVFFHLQNLQTHTITPTVHIDGQQKSSLKAYLTNTDTLQNSKISLETWHESLNP